MDNCPKCGTMRDSSRKEWTHTGDDVLANAYLKRAEKSEEAVWMAVKSGLMDGYIEHGKLVGERNWDDLPSVVGALRVMRPYDPAVARRAKER